MQGDGWRPCTEQMGWTRTRNALLSTCMRRCTGRAGTLLSPSVCSLTSPTSVWRKPVLSTVAFSMVFAAHMRHLSASAAVETTLAGGNNALLESSMRFCKALPLDGDTHRTVFHKQVPLNREVESR